MATERRLPFDAQSFLAKVGTTRSRVSFFMNKFRRLGLVITTAAAWKFTAPC
jgi:hypothetical protein